MLDIFRSNLFGVIELTDAINSPIFRPRRLASLGLFQETPVATTTVMIEMRGGQLVLVAPSPRGGPGQTIDKVKRNGRPFSIPHFEINDGVMAEEVQGVRAFGSEDQVMFLQDLLSERLMLHRESHEVTIEYSRIGAVQGLVTYADGTQLNLFTEFGVAPEPEANLDLANANPEPGGLRKLCAGLTRKMGGNLDGIPFSGIRAVCGDDLFDALLQHPEVRATFLNNPAAEQLRQAYIGPNGEIWGQFEFGGIVWENYRGGVGATKFVNDDKANLFPIGVPGLFRTYFAPADYIETVNRPGQRTYAKQYEMPNGKGIHLDSQTNNLNICTRPKALMTARRA
ncbi:major capsid protein [Bradyrhizobium valentinum]|uniref:Elements of external origin n=1 Tax=Bradyrhizobium valentinum TaxID=1518501 RepID=A0A0R3KUU5_9BRAD|nr:major capsid protein [Bradyrhizobium valentinum]KRQ99273.1 hypothetical protein CP49_11800 [Bradyrhizobium valentinum]